jgi:hypothetical protein
VCLYLHLDELMGKLEIVLFRLIGMWRRNDEPVIRTIDQRNQRGGFDTSACHQKVPYK